MRITVFGGSGFLGHYVVRELAEAGHTVTIACRDPEGAKDLRTAGAVGQVVPVYANLRKPEDIKRTIANSHAVVNLVGVLYSRGKQRFSALHAQGAEKLAQAAKEAGVQRLIHISALGVDKATRSTYARTKLAGEKAVLAAFPEATILRPSVVFGPEDNFFNQFACMARLSPFLPLIGGGKTRFQPVYAGDVGKAVLACLERPESKGKTYELAGPETFTFRQILEYVLKTTRRRRILLPLPLGLASMIGAFGELLPVPPLTRDQVTLLETDNVTQESMPGLGELGITPTGVESVVPEYLARYRAPGATGVITTNASA
ncbi:MAG: complex I NDUFA9 subunit family protein [Alphaproteobacteria bacterium]|nr:complex I NDUFA9 subunit family protein [Alphaproteobacteria bacterium]